jgi:hypothetical protein
MSCRGIKSTAGRQAADSSDSDGDGDIPEGEDEPQSKHGKALSQQVQRGVNAGRPLILFLRAVRPHFLLVQFLAQLS